MKKFLLTTLLLAISMVFFAACSGEETAPTSGASGGDRPHAGRRLVVYTTTRPEFHDPLLESFIEETGIHLEFMNAGAGELLSRIRAEAANPIADVMLGGLLATTSAHMDLFEDFRTVHEPQIIENFKNTEGMLTRFQHQGSVLIVNTDLIGDIQINGYADLLNPELRGRIAMTDPAASGSAFDHLVNKLYAMGNGDPHAGWDFVESFMDNVNGVMLGSSSAVIRGVADGEFVVGLTFEEGPMPYIEGGAPVEMIYMEEGVIFGAGGVYIVNDTPNRDIAELFVDFVLSHSTQVLMEETLHRRSVRSDVVADGLLLPLSDINVIYADTAYITQNRDEWLDIFMDIMTR
jgi:iron(III) transport system substrate-binding protein